MYRSIKTVEKKIQCNSSLLHTSNSLLHSRLKPQDFTSTNEALNVNGVSADSIFLSVYGINYRMEIHFFVFM